MSITAQATITTRNLPIQVTRGQAPLVTLPTTTPTQDLQIPEPITALHVRAIPDQTAITAVQAALEATTPIQGPVVLREAITAITHAQAVREAATVLHAQAAPEAIIHAQAAPVVRTQAAVIQEDLHRAAPARHLHTHQVHHRAAAVVEAAVTAAAAAGKLTFF